MSFTSYAQNFEDVMLWRALKHVQNGVYVDVGAQHPVVDSVSKAFYERGWKGIHIEPVLEYARLLREDRPEEVVLQVALADIEGTLELNVIPNTGLSTAVDAFAERHELERGFDRQRMQVPILTLKSALMSLVGKDVHWLKIDVEGFEGKVLQGWDSQILRPWIMVVEATIPGSPETNYADWNPILTAADYQFVYFDGLNRFYVAKEHAYLAEAFSCPPNVFDDVRLSVSSGLCQDLIARHQAKVQELSAEAEIRAEQAEVRAAQAEDRAAQIEIRAEQAEVRATQAEDRAAQIEIQATQAEMRVEKAEVRAVQAEDRATQIETQATQAEMRAEQAEVRAAQAEDRATQIEEHSHSILSSSSWRVTAPLRLVGSNWYRVRAAIRTGTFISGANRRFKSQLRPFGLWVLHQPRLTQAALKVVNRMPAIKHRLRGIVLGPAGVSGTVSREAQARSNLSPRAAHIYDELKKATDARKS